MSEHPLERMQVIDDKHVLGSDGLVYVWHKCSKPGCNNRVWPDWEDRFCYPCTGSGKTFAELLEDVGVTDRVSGEE